MIVEDVASERLANRRECYACTHVIEGDTTRCNLCGAPQPRARGTTGSSTIVVPKQAEPPRRRRRRSTAAILALCLGGVGAHKLYLGERKAALVRLLLCWTLVPAVIALVDFVRLLQRPELDPLSKPTERTSPGEK